MKLHKRLSRSGPIDYDLCLAQTGQREAKNLELEIKVQPKAKRNAIEVSGTGEVTVRVTAAPDNGKANDAVISLLAKRLRLPKGGVEIVRGYRSRTKLVRIQDLTRSQLMERLAGS